MTVYRREDARAITPQEKLSPLDLNIYERAIDKVEQLIQELEELEQGYEDRELTGEEKEQLQQIRSSLREYEWIMDTINEDCGIGSKQFLDIVRWLNEKLPNEPILVTSDYVADVREATEPDWVIPGIAVRNNTTLLYGEPGVGKTTFYLYLTDALMNGSEFAGIQCARCNPLIVCQDEDHSLLKNHWATMGKTELLPVAKKEIVWDKGKGDFIEDFEKTLKAYNPDVVFIDSYTSLGIPDITRPESGIVYDVLNKKARHYKCAIILIHHTNLSGEQMGSTLHKAKVSSMVSISKLTEDRIMVTQEKVRGSHFEPIVIHFNRENLRMTRQPGNVKDEVRRMVREGKSENEIISGLSTAKKETIKRYIREIRQEG